MFFPARERFDPRENVRPQREYIALRTIFCLSTQNNATDVTCLHFFRDYIFAVH